MDEAWPQTRALPKSIQGKAKAGLHEIWMAETQIQVNQAFDRFARDFGAKYLKAVEKLLKNRTVMPAL